MRDITLTCRCHHHVYYIYDASVPTPYANKLIMACQTCLFIKKNSSITRYIVVRWSCWSVFPSSFRIVEAISHIFSLISFCLLIDFPSQLEGAERNWYDGPQVMIASPVRSSFDSESHWPLPATCIRVTTQNRTEPITHTCSLALLRNHTQTSMVGVGSRLSLSCSL